jgi:hypothetical protein
MAFANANISDIVATTIESRTKKIADNVTNNNAVLRKLSMRGKIKTFSGGSKILQELSFAENANAGWYSGYDLLPVGVSDVISAAEYTIKQCAVPVVISGLEQLQNAGKEQMIDLLEARISVAEATMANLIAEGLYSDGTAAGGKQLDGLNAALPTNPALAPYGGINGATFTFWQNKVQAGATATMLADMNSLWALVTRGPDRTDLIMMSNSVWLGYLAKLQAQQRFESPEVGQLGFPSLKFIDADVVLDGGIYDFGRTGAAANTAYFLNTNYIHYRPHADRNMVPLSPNKRYAVNQDAEVSILAFAGNLTTSGRKYQGRFNFTP